MYSHDINVKKKTEHICTLGVVLLRISAPKYNNYSGRREEAERLEEKSRPQPVAQRNPLSDTPLSYRTIIQTYKCVIIIFFNQIQTAH